MVRLSVNINKFATLRNARGGNNPDVLQAALSCERFGAQGITVHPRPDERHITTRDVYELAEAVTTEFNIEGYPDERYLRLIRETRPAQATLVPDPPGVLTSNAGWDTVREMEFLKRMIGEIKGLGVRTSLFIETHPTMIESAALTGADRVELYTESYATGFEKHRKKAVAPYIAAAQLADSLGLGVNAGHDLNRQNLRFFKESIPQLKEVSIGHALICEAIYLGLENTVQLYRRALR